MRARFLLVLLVGAAVGAAALPCAAQAQYAGPFGGYGYGGGPGYGGYGIAPRFGYGARYGYWRGGYGPGFRVPVFAPPYAYAVPRPVVVPEVIVAPPVVYAPPVVVAEPRFAPPVVRRVRHRVVHRLAAPCPCVCPVPAAGVPAPLAGGLPGGA